MLFTRIGKRPRSYWQASLRRRPQCRTRWRKGHDEFAFIAALLLSTSAWGALPGVIELGTPPEKITDTQLAPLLDKRIAEAEVVALGETVHASSGFLKIQTRLIRYLVEKHGFRLIVWENPPLRSLELARWVSSCRTSKSAPPIDVLYLPTPSDLPLWEWICDFNRANPKDTIVFRGMDVWDRPWEHYARIRTLAAGAGIDRRVLEDMDKLCPASRSASWADIEVVLAQVQSERHFSSKEDYEKCRATLTSLFKAARQSGLDRQKKKDAAADDAFELAISASTLLGWLGFYNYNWSDDILSWNARDEAQGRNTLLIMEKHAVARAIVSAHTSHVSHNRSRADWWGFGDIKSGIHFFTAMTGKRSSTSHSPGTKQVALKDSGCFRRLRILSTRSCTTRSILSHSSRPTRLSCRKIRDGGSRIRTSGSYESGVELVLRDHFDAFIFLDRSHLDRALPARPMWEP